MGVLFDVACAERALAALIASHHPPDNLTPAIRFSNPASRALQVESLTTLLRDINETYSHAVRLQEQFEALAFSLGRRRAAVVTAMAPVSGLPTEILREIFMIVTDSDRTSKARIVLSHVSSDWRAVALGLRELWTVIEVPSHCPEMVHEFARRSGNLPLELSKYSEVGDWPSDLELDSEEASRLSILRLSDDWDVPPTTILGSFQHLVSLDKLIVTGRSVDTIPQSFMSCKSLETSNTLLGDFFEDLHARQSSTRMERLTSIRMEDTAVDQVRRVLDFLEAPLLHELYLSEIDVFVDRWEEDSGRVRHYDQVRTVTITNCLIQVWRFILNTWEMPYLTSLALGLEEWSAWAPQPRERESEWDNLPDYLYTLLSHLPGLEDVNISVTNAYEAYSRFIWDQNSDGDRCLVPRLHTLRFTCKKCDRRCSMTLPQAVQERSKESKARPLQCLTLSRSIVSEEVEASLRGCVGALFLLDEPA